MAEYELDPDTYIQNAVIAAAHAAADDSKSEKPKEFQYKNWISWEDSLEIYLESINSVCGVPLSYVIRKDLPLGSNWDDLDHVQQRIRNTKLEGLAFNIDSKAVLTVMKEACIGTDAEVWIKGKKCGRSAMMALREHYDGPDEAKKRTLEAKQKLSSCFYKHEFTFSFEKFISVLEGCFKTLERYGIPMYESDKVDTLFECCQNNHPEFKQEVTICRSKHDTFIGAITYIKTVVARLFPSSGAKKSERRGVGAVTTNVVNDVDISDLAKYYSKNEVKKINSTEEGRKQ